MSLWVKIKQVLGIGGVKVQVQAPEQIPRVDVGSFQGSVKLIAKSDQEILGVTVSLVEEWTTGRGDDQQTKEFELGTTELEQAFALTKGETRILPFQLDFALIKSNAEQLADAGGALGAMGKFAKFAGGEKSKFKVRAEADVKGTLLDPSGEADIRLVAS